MTWKLKGSLLAAAVATASVASQAQAAFNYDLRFAPGQGQTDAHDLTLTHTGTYTLQLWGQITGDTNLTNDGWINGWVSLSSAQTSLGAITAGGITGASLGTNAQAAAGSPSVGAVANITTDTISDWGSSNTGATTGWMKWVGGANPGFLDGAAGAESEQVNANTWEVLLATFTVTATTLGVSPGTTTFNVIAPLVGVKSGPVTTLDGLDYTLDNGAQPTKNGSTFTPAVFLVGGGGVTTPEPASLGLLALGGLALMNRRRKA